MNTCAFEFAGTQLHALGSGALWWEAEKTLVVSDLHLAKSDRIARRGGGLLPPYETLETLNKLERDIATCGPERVISLGDSFDDDQGAQSLDPTAASLLTALVGAHDWIWITGNHDPAPKGFGGRNADEARLVALVFRHIASDVADGFGEVSGHFHPKLRLQTRAGMVSRPVFVWDKARLILPAYGAYTGGLDLRHPELASRFDQASCNAMMTGTKPFRVPVSLSREGRTDRLTTGRQPPLRRGNFG